MGTNSNSEGWHLSPTAGWTCDQVCSNVGLSCSEAEQHAHNADVSSPSGMARIMSSFGNYEYAGSQYTPSCLSYNQRWGTSGDVPCWRITGADGSCYISSPSRTASQYNCAQTSSD